MGNLLLVGWLFLIIVNAALCIRIFWTDGTALPNAQTNRLLVILLILAPPAFSAGMTLLFLLNAQPTAQLNAYNDSAMDWWSTWVHLWPTIWIFTAIQIPFYAILTLICIFHKALREFTASSGIAFLCGGVGMMLLGMAMPKA